MDSERTVRATTWLGSGALRRIARAARLQGLSKPEPDHGCRGAYALNLARRYVERGEVKSNEEAYQFFESALTA